MPLIFEGRAIETVMDPSLTDSLQTFVHNNAITTFEISDVYKGAKQSKIEIIHRVGHGASCAMEFSTTESSLVFAYKLEDGSYSANQCTKGYGFSNEQIREYLTTGQDVLRLSKLCRYDFHDAYRNQIYSQHLKLRNPGCMAVKHLYDVENPTKQETEYMDGKRLDPIARKWAEYYTNYACKIQLGGTLETLNDINPYLLSELDDELKTMSGRQLTIYADRVAKRRNKEMERSERDQLAGYLYFQAAKKGYPRAMRQIGDAALSCKYGLDQDTETAKRWLTKAFEAGDTRAPIQLASMHLAGLTDTQNRKQTALNILESCKDLNRRSCRKEYDMLKSAIDNR